MIRNYNILRSILSEPWLISQTEVSRLGFLLSGVFNKNLAFEPILREDLAGISYRQSVGQASDLDNSAHEIGILKITGPLSKYDPECSYGMETYDRMFRKMDADRTLSAIVLIIDSPGGMVSGTEDLYNTIKGAHKPVVAYVSDMACSAAYWIACGAKKIIANNTTAEVGSIGVYCQYVDVSDMLKAQGITIHTIEAPESPDKLKESRNICAGKYDETKKRLSAIAQKFQMVVRDARSGVKDEQLTGYVYNASDVIGSLVDDIGSLEFAVQTAADMAVADNNKKTKKMAKTNKFERLAREAGLSAIEVSDGYLALSEDQAALIDEALKAADNPATSQETIDQLNTRITQLEAENATLTDQVAQQGSAAGDAGASVTPGKDADGEALGGIDTKLNDFSAAMKTAMNFVK